ncbi:MAG: nitroreductase family protein [Tildeniella torsiva UHER 1998/13D]|jgi:nitroreductase|nr:nitroreductase family protein [Tildeniella torsiva UHER 1998/13D]
MQGKIKFYIKNSFSEDSLVYPLKAFLAFKKLRDGALKSIEIYLVRFFSSSKFLTSIYYLLLSKSFKREQYACLIGRMRYYDSLHSKESNSYLLRRNTHRLEKGLLMRPRRDIFAAGYIAETVDCFFESVNQNNSSQNLEELKWANDVLSEYFDVVGSQPGIDKARAKFKSALGASIDVNESLKFIPYKRDSSVPLSVSYESFLSLSQRRRSVRWYLSKPVPRDLIDKAVKVASLSPSACNRQPFEFRIFDDPDLVQKISVLPMGTKGFSHNFPVVVVVVGKLSAYFSERDRHIIYIDGSLAAMSFMYGLETLGLSSCPINWPDVEPLERKMDKLLKLEPDERPVMLISVGYPDPEGMVAFSQKKSLEKVRRYN